MKVRRHRLAATASALVAAGLTLSLASGASADSNNHRTDLTGDVEVTAGKDNAATQSIDLLRNDFTYRYDEPFSPNGDFTATAKIKDLRPTTIEKGNDQVFVFNIYKGKTKTHSIGASLLNRTPTITRISDGTTWQCGTTDVLSKQESFRFNLRLDCIEQRGDTESSIKAGFYAYYVGANGQRSEDWIALGLPIYLY